LASFIIFGLGSATLRLLCGVLIACDKAKPKALRSDKHDNLLLIMVRAAPVVEQRESFLFLFFFVRLAASVAQSPTKIVSALCP
jgi:hypothetical protein